MIKALIVLLLAVAVFGSAAYFGYELFIKPRKLMELEKLEPPPPAPPDPTLPEWEKVEAVVKSGKLQDARAAIEAFIENNPISTKLDEARKTLGDINVRLMLTPYPSPDKKEYVVVSGDVLNRIAGRTKTTPEFIARSNNLKDVRLKIGQRLWIAQPDFQVLIDRKQRKLTILNHGRFFKEYKPIEWNAPPPKSSARLTGKITDVIAWNAAGTRTGFGFEDFAGSTRWISLSIPGYALYALPPEGSELKPPASGLRFTREEMDEMGTLLKKGVPVIAD
jgi:LysM repeat protein